MNENQIPIRLIVHGAAGRMGRRVVALALDDPAVDLAGAIDHDDHPLLGQDAGTMAGVSPAKVSLSADFPDEVSGDGVPPVVIDFSLPEALDGCIDACVRQKLPLVVATTGLSPEQQARLRKASDDIPVVWAPSMSLAVNLSMKMAQQITKALRDVSGGVDVEILERHHRYKADAPSGTALRFGELIAQSMVENHGDAAVDHVHGRHGHTGQRTRNEIGYHAIRVGDNPGEHTIVFGMLGEKIELNVAASNRDCYAGGAIAAAKWLMRRSEQGTFAPGLHDMFDVLGMSDPA